jgi:hypothetical protein
MPTTFTAASCPKVIRGCALRITRQDACDVVIAEATASRAVALGFMSMKITPDIQAGTEIMELDACDNIVVYDKGCDKIKGFKLELHMSSFSAPALELMIGAPLLVDGTGNVIGQAMPAQNSICSQTSVQLELWAKNANAAACGTAKYVHFVLPKTFNWQMTGDLTFEKGMAIMQLSGFAVANPSWVPSIASEWTAGNITAIKAAGPLAWEGATALPTLNDCAYLP